MCFNVSERNLKQNVLKYIKDNLIGKYSNPEHEKILSELIRKLQQPVLPDFSEIEQRIINILFLKIFSENEECLVVFARLIESLKNMIACLELLAIYAAKVNSLLTDEIMKKYYHDLRDKHYEWQEDAKRYVLSRVLDHDEFIRDINFIIQDLKKILDDKSKPFFDEIEDMNCVIHQVQKSIQMIKLSNAEQFVKIIFSSPEDELFPDFKSKIRELFTRWSKIQDELLKFVNFEFLELESDVDEEEDKQFEQKYGSSEDSRNWKEFNSYNSGQDDDKTNLMSALENLYRAIC